MQKKINFNSKNERENQSGTWTVNCVDKTGNFSIQWCRRSSIV